MTEYLDRAFHHLHEAIKEIAEYQKALLNAEEEAPHDEIAKHMSIARGNRIIKAIVDVEAQIEDARARELQRGMLKENDG